MKISKNIKELTTTQTEMAKVLGITQQRVSQLVKDGTIIRNDSAAVIVIESLKNFYKLNLGENGEEKDLSFDHEKALHEKAKREFAELRLAEKKNEMHNTSDIELMVGGLIIVFKRRILGMPNKMASLLVGKSADDINELLTNEIHSALTELAKFDASKLGEQVDDDDSEDN
jgi:plasmid maintenance system antidote protein VapI